MAPARSFERVRRLLASVCTRRSALMALVVVVLASAACLWASVSPSWQVRHISVVGVSDASPVLLWRLPTGTVAVAADDTILGTASAAQTAHLPSVDDADAFALDGQTPRAGTKLAPHTIEMATQLRKEVPAAVALRWSLVYVVEVGFEAHFSGSGTVVDFGVPTDAAALICPDVTRPCPADAVARGVTLQVAALHGLLLALGRRHEVASVVDLRWGTHPYYRLAGEA